MCVRYIEGAFEPASDVGVFLRADGKIYLNDDGEPCKIDNRGGAYRVGRDSRRFLPSYRPRDKYTLEEWDKLGSAGRKIEIEIAKEAEKKKAKAEKKNEKAEKNGTSWRKRSRRPSRSCGRRKVKTRQLLSSSLRVKIVVQLARKDGTLGRCTTYGRFGSR